MVDLHAHSTASDGQLSPTALVELAKGLGLEVLALTDHDTVAGLAEAAAACQVHGLKFVPGIELEVAVEKGEFHLLGLGLDATRGEWPQGLPDIQEQRVARNLQIVAKMREAGLNVSYDEIAARAGGQVGRPHFARYLVDRGVVESVQDAFDKFLGRGSLFYVPKAALPLEEAVRWVHAAGGLAIVAHPMSLQLSMTALEAFLQNAQERGLDGVEAWHPSAPPRQCRRIERLATRLGLKISAGSDFHGEHRPGRQLGLTSGGQPIQRRVFEELFA